MPEKVVYRLAGIIRFRMLMIAAGYEDGNDADTLRRDPMFKLALDRLPSGDDLCSQSTISRLCPPPRRRDPLPLAQVEILAENHIKAWKNHLAADRTSCHAAEANRALGGLDARKMPLHLDTGKGKP
jgi:hypothetical protein